MKKIVFQGILGLLLVSFNSCKVDSSKKEYVEDRSPASPVDWGLAHGFYLKNINESIGWLDSLARLPMESKEAKLVFSKARNAFKRAEPFGAYLNPEIGHRANGPALPILTDDSQRVLQPVGLQKIEESLFEGEVAETQYQKEINVTKGLLNNLKTNIEKRELTAQRFFIATHQQLMRIISLGISGFDTPVSLWGLEETLVSLKALEEVYTLSIKNLILKKDRGLDEAFHKSIAEAERFIEENPNFMEFDRFTFIRDYMNPITRHWVEIRRTANIWDPVDNKPFNFDAPTFFEEDAFNLDFFTPSVNQNPNPERIALGKRLFFDPKLSENGKMACVSCHNPSKAWADGMVVNLDKNGNPLQRNTPTLINSAFQQAFFWDGRSPNLLDQISSVFTNDKEFDSSIHQFDTEILQDSSYVEQFKQAFGGISGRNTQVIKAISSYISTLNGFNSKFDKNIRGEEDTFTEEEKLGFNLYMGKALCATCHFIPLTNGTVPPFFNDHEKEVIGVPETVANQQLDDDLGFYWRFEMDLHKGMFKTPTVRNADVTAPYMHNGVYRTLEEVMDFYNEGGGGGMGFDLEYQTLPFDELNLTIEEQNAIIAFMRTLTDNKVPYDEAYSEPNKAL
ncbi:cytochrome-c peroxidase [Ulvibacterium sp.]|uniref:cytochrome-c peroxidase n=1 Tax=Ulvibacterium sp. TaxID=2665914 RepID=UPI003BAD3B33